MNNADFQARSNLGAIFANVIKAIDAGCEIADLKADINLGPTGIEAFLEGDQEGDIVIDLYLVLRRPKIENQGPG